MSFKKISTAAAKKQWNSNQELWLFPAKLPTNHYWKQPLRVNKKNFGENTTLEFAAEEYARFNCTAATGKSVAYYTWIYR